MQYALAEVRTHVDVLYNASAPRTGRRPRTGKIERHKAVVAIRNAISKKSTVNALTAASVQEMVCGPQEDSSGGIPPLGWVELTIVLLETLNQACSDALTSRATSKTGRVTFRSELVFCFKEVLKLSLTNGPAGVIRPAVPAFLFFAHQWLSEPALRPLLADQVWQCVRDILQDDANRAMLTPPFIRTWVDVCVEQLTNRGPLYHSSTVVSQLAGDVLETIARNVDSYDTLTQSTKSLAPSKMLGGDFGYAIVCERCCFMLVIAETKRSASPRDARQIQAVAFRTLTVALSNQLLDAIGSNAVESIINVSLPAMIACWTDGRHHDVAVSFAKVLLLIAPSHRKLVDTCRQRLLVDLRDEGSSAVLRAGQDVKDDFVDCTASCFSLRESLHFASSPESSWGLVIVWLRVCIAILSRRVLKKGTTMVLDAQDLLDQCTSAAEAVTAILRGHEKIQESFYDEVIRCCTRTVNLAASIADRVAVDHKATNSFAQEAWNHLYVALREHVRKTKYSVPRRGKYGVGCQNVRTDEHLLKSLSLLRSLQLFEHWPARIDAMHMDSQSDLPYPISRLTSSKHFPSAMEIEYTRTLIARNGVPDLHGRRLRLRLALALVGLCKDFDASRTSAVKTLVDASCVVLGLARGECTISHCPAGKSCVDVGEHISKELVSDAFNAFQSYFGYCASEEKIIGEGSRLVAKVKQQELVWPLRCASVDKISGSPGESGVTPDCDKHLSSVQTRKHFSVDPAITDEIESSILLKAKAFLNTTRAGSLRKMGVSYTSVSEHSSEVEEVHDLSEEHLSHTKAKLIVFLGSYLLQGISLGSISTGKKITLNENRASEELMKLLTQLTKSFSCSPFAILVSRIEMSLGVIQVSCSLLKSLETCLRPSSGSTMQDHAVWDQLLQALSKSMSSISAKLSTGLAEAYVMQTKENITKIHHFTNGNLSDLSSQQLLPLKRSRGPTSPPTRHRAKRKRVSRGHLDLERRNDENDHRDMVSSHEDHNAFGDESGNHYDSDSSKSDGFGFENFATDQNQMRGERRRNPREQLSASRLAKNASSLLRACVKELPTVEDLVLDNILEGIQHLDDLESALSPDGFERSALASTLVDHSFLDLRTSLWVVLFSLRTNRAVEAAARDLLKAGLYWRGLETTAHQYVSFYMESLQLSNNSRKHYPLPCFLEQFRISFLDYSRIFLKKCQLPDDSDAAELNRSHIREPQRCPLHLVSSIVEVSEHFRTRHAFRMPRMTRVSYYRFGLAALELFCARSVDITAATEQESPQSTTLQNMIQAIRAALLKFLSDSEATVRFVAALLFPRLLATFRCPVSQLETILRDSIPQSSACRESASYYGKVIGARTGADTQSAVVAQLSLSAHEQIGCASISESFRTIGARAKAHTVFVVLCELGSAREDLLPVCLLLILLRVLKNGKHVSAAYQALVRLCMTKGYYSPRHLYQTFARLLLSKWFQHPQALQWLYQFPASVLVDLDHHRDGVLFDWMREQQSVILPHVLVLDTAPSLPRTTELAEAIGVDLKVLLSTNVASFSLIFPMQFAGSLHEKGRDLWKAVDNVLEGKSKELMFKHKAEVLRSFLVSTSCGCITGQPEIRDRLDQVKKLGFSRDTREVQPPLYDPLVVALAIDQLFEVNSNRLIIQRSILKGSLFADLRDEENGVCLAANFNGVLEECQKSKVFLIRMLVMISKFLMGPPNPKPAQHRRDAFFCVGMLWRTLGVNILVKSSSERVIFYKLMAKGFEHYETVHDAAWLLLEVQKEVSCMADRYPEVNVIATDLTVDPAESEHLHCMTTSSERQMFELLSAVTPVLVSIVSKSTRVSSDVLHNVSLVSLNNLVQVCYDEGLWTSILCNGPYPKSKHFLKLRALYEASKASAECNPTEDAAGAIVAGLKRFHVVCRLRAQNESFFPTFACIQELHRLLSDSAVSELSRRMNSEAWVRSNGQHEQTAPHVRRAISCLLQFVHAIERDLRKRKPEGSFVSRTSTRLIHNERTKKMEGMAHEIADVMALLGLLQPQSEMYIRGESRHRLIPSLTLNQGYEEISCGIRLSLVLLLKMVHGASPIAAEAAITTLIQILGTEDGKRLYNRDKFALGICTPFRNAARKLAVTAGSSSTINIIDPSTGEPVPWASFPALMDSRLWDINKDERLSLPGHESWMRRFCCVLANMCESGALKTLSVPCYISYQFASEMLPYLLMDVVSQKKSQNHVDMGYLLCENILNDPKTPSNIIRAFVHALDVLCQVGSRVICQKGITSAIEEGKAWPICRPRYVLAVPYIDAARAALRTGCYFSAVRFCQMHVDEKVAEREFRIFSRAQNHKTDRKRPYMTRDSSVERAEEKARNDVKDILLLAMTRIQEPDGVRAFGNNANLSQAAAGLATLDEDWIRSLSALDIASRMTRGSSWSIARQPTGEIGSEMLDMDQELSLFHSLLRLGTLSIATDYWSGLRCRASKNGLEHQGAAPCYENSPIEKLNDLRYAVAWKLGQWESPALLPSCSPSARGTERPHGFHGTIYRVLHSFRTERFVEALRLLSSSKTRELLGLVRDSSGVSAGTVYATAARLQIFRILEEAQLQCSPPVTKAGKESQWFDSGGKTRTSTAPVLQLNVESRSEFDRDSEDQVIRRPGLTLKTNGIIDRVLQGSFGGYDAGSANSAIVPFRDAFSDIVLAEELPIALVHCLRADKMTARAAATISARVLRAGGSGAWSRSASCLGTELSSQLVSASHVDRVAWKLQEARLRWLSSHDAASRKIALAAVKDIISAELGGRPESRNSNVSEDATPPQAVVWDPVADDCDKHAFLRSEACRLAAIWSLDMRTHEPMKLFETFLESGLQAVHASAEAKHLACPAHMAMATFADAQLANIDAYRKTRKYDEMVSSLRAAEEKICKLKTMKNKRQAKPKKSSGRMRRSSRSEVTSGATTDHQIGRDLQMLINNEAKKAQMDRLRLENLNDLYRKWQIIACKHFASSLRDGDAQDLRAAFRFVALWLDAGQMRDTITTELAIDKNGVDIGVPVSKLLPLAPQLSSRLSPLGSIGSGAFQIALSNTIRQMAEKFPAYCLWQLVALSNSTRISTNQEKYASLYLGDKDKKEAADKILNDLTALHGDAVRDMKRVADAYILLSETSDSQKSRGYLDMSQSLLLKLGELENVPVPTVPLPLNANDYRGDLPHIVKFEGKASVCAGLSKPLRIVCCGSDGKSYPQMVKGRDDLRGDAVMEQLFTILNSLLERDADAAKRSLLVRTYRIVPLSPFSGIMQFVSNTQQFKEILTEKNKSNGLHRGGASLHERYRPNDMKHEKIFEKAFRLKSRENQSKRIQFLATVWHVFQPVFRFFFLEQWPDPAEWFSHQLAYSRSVAVMSVVGFILGLGDRHLSNILMDIVTGEVVHIDFGIAFEQGKLLPTPERMPFRLTRDLVDGFGIAGVEGVFRRCSEVTLSVMQRNKDVLLTIVEVLLHDPMFNWALTPEEVLREQKSRDGSDQDIFESDDLSRSLDESAVAQKVNNDISGSTEAHRALNRISEKLDGLEGTERLSVEAHVARLIDEAQAFHVIAAVYPGWAPWL